MAYKLMFKKASSSKKDDDEIMMNKCKKHPKHKQSPGVCALCLREKLSHQISSTSMGSYSSSSSSPSSSLSSSLSSYYSSSAASSCSSPMYNFTTTSNHHQGKQQQYSLSTLLFGHGGGGGAKNNNNKVLTKSRSLAFVPRKGSDKHGHNETKKKPNGIFSKLLLIKPRTKKMDEALVHSRTTREIIVAT